jgi:hypothetical protein
MTPGWKLRPTIRRSRIDHPPDGPNFVCGTTPYPGWSVADQYLWAAGHARGLSTRRLLRLGRRGRRRHGGDPIALATLAAVRAELAERGVEVEPL